MKELIERMAHPKDFDVCSNDKSSKEDLERELAEQTLRYEKNNEKLNKLENAKLEWKVKKQKTQDLLNEIELQDKLISEFDESLWYALVEKVIVNHDGSMDFQFKNSQAINI